MNMSAEPGPRSVQINEQGSFVQTGELELSNEILPYSILSGTDIGSYNTTTGVFSFTGFLVGFNICRVCHSECKFGCVGQCLQLEYNIWTLWTIWTFPVESGLLFP